MRLWRVAGTQVGRPGNEGAKSALLWYILPHKQAGKMALKNGHCMYRKNKVSLSTSSSVKQKKRTGQIKEVGGKLEQKQRHVLIAEFCPHQEQNFNNCDSSAN